MENPFFSYVIDLLGIDDDYLRRYENLALGSHSPPYLNSTNMNIREECSCFEIIKPGFTRLNLPYFASDAEIDFVLQAVVAVAKRGWTLLPQYLMNRETGEYHHVSHKSSKDRKL